MSQKHEHHRPRRGKRRTLPGASPGTLVADPTAGATVLRVIAYGPDDHDARTLSSIDEIPGILGTRPVVWVNVDGLGDVDVIRRLGEMYGLHTLALEDVVHVHQRPKVEPYEDHLFIVTRMPSRALAGETEQLSLFFGPGFVLTFQERPGDFFDAVRDRLRKGRGRIRGSGADYLTYALLDAAIDAYFPVLEEFGDRLERIEDEIIANTNSSSLSGVFSARRQLLSIRRALWPQRESIGVLVRDSDEFVTEETRVFLRDCHDHVVQLVDVVETHRELTSGLMDLYLSSVSHRMNEVMKVLTIIATIFIPMSFVAGLYGMNFDREASPWNMPELGWAYGYPMLVVVLLGIAATMLVYFRRRGWLGRGDLHDGAGSS